MNGARRSAVARLIKFNLVGGIGVALQLALLSLLNRGARVPYLAATAIAVELTVLHNFAWHELFTWRHAMRSGADGIARRLARFHLANGAVSIFGNLSLMSLLSGVLHLPLLLANGFAIVVCSILNFLMADRWVFAISSNEG